MVSEEGLITYQYDKAHKTDLEKFCLECKELGYHNNNSINSMRLYWCLDQGGQFYLTYLNNKLIGLSGCHPLTDVDKSTYRILFRGIELPEYRNVFKVMSKTHMSSIPFYYHVPLEIIWAQKNNAKHIVVTTNWNNPDGITSMNKSHRVFQGLNKQGIVNCLVEKVSLFGVEQSVWDLNLDRYFEAREGFRIRNGLR